ncbi:SIR2 family protein [Pseudomonas protegens]|uniref:SIR2 family protein n=1 Tax=Pseudomonas protegens TaxID=380021 RepID=UPI001C69F9C0|nr:SIR2 family protein [Pseudomonas protegens]QYM99283.1 SIR2 family protein [Pseudomonas protegens]
MITWSQTLINDLESRRVVVFLGSGVSRNSLGEDNVTRPKTWQSFLEDAAQRVDIVDEIAPFMQSRDYLTVLDLIRNRSTRDAYAEIVKQEYLDPRYSEAKIHELIYQLDANIVLTPNFDKIYDVYASSKSRGTTAIKQYYELDLARYVRGDRRVVVKIHGSVDSPENMIFGRRDYAEARVKHSWFYDILKSLILTHTFLFIGCGTDDPDIRLLLEDAQFTAGFAREHYFLAANGSISPGFKVILESTMNLRVLEYAYDPQNHDHSALTDSLEQLADSLSWNA